VFANILALKLETLPHQGAMTGCCSALVLLPSEVIKAKTQVVVGESVSSQDIMKRMIKQSGYKVRRK
jgi:solute carrier family 25 ornithine transporter 2/15